MDFAIEESLETILSLVVGLAHFFIIYRMFMMV